MAKKKTTSKSKLGSNETSVKARRAAPGKTKSTTVARGARSVETGKDGSAGYAVLGTVSYPDKSPAVGLRVVAFDKDIGGENRLGECVTDASGAYRIPYDEATFRRSKSERGGADVLVRAYDETGKLLGQTKIVRNAPARLELDLILSAAYAVSGVIVDAADHPVAGLRVVAFDKDLRKEQELGGAVTDEAGGFRIAYSRNSFALAERGRADVILRVFAAGKLPGALLLEWGLPAGGDPETPVRLVVGAMADPLSEYERIAAKIQPLLAGQGQGDADLAMIELVADDVAFLIRETGLDADRLRTFVGAQAAAGLTRPEPVKSRAGGKAGLPAEFFYALLRAGVNGDGDALMLQPRVALETALDWALSAAIVPASIGKAKGALLDAWDRWRSPRAATRAGAGGKVPTATVLQAVGTRLPQTLRERVTLLAAREGGLRADLVTELERDDKLSAEERASLVPLRSAIAYADAAGGDAALFEAMMKAAADATPISRAQDVVRLSRGQWGKVAESLPAADNKPGADELMRRFDAAYLSEAALARVNGGEIEVSPDAKSALARLAKTQPALTLGGTGDVSLARVLGGASGKDAIAPQACVDLLQLDGLLAATGSAMDVADLTRAGYRSASDVLAGGRQDFISHMSDKKGRFLTTPWLDVRASGVFDAISRAREAGTLAVIGALAKDISPPVAALGGKDGTGTQATLADLASTRGRCACQSCRSVLSLSAYLADLLVFLRDTGQTQGRTPLDVLLQRRPDVQEVLLDCGNEQTPVSYVDLVNEVLERAVATSTDPDWLLLARNSSGAAFVPELDQGRLPVSLAVELAGADVRLAQDARVVTLTAGVRWRVLDAQWVVDLVNRSASPVNPASRGVRATPWPQSGDAATGSDARRLLRAYEVLDDAVYPWSLPFDLPRVLVGGAFAVRGVTEALLRGVFEPGSQEAASLAAARVRLGLSSREARELASATPLSESDVAARWGFGDVGASVDDPSPQFDGATRPRITGWKAIAARLFFFLERGALQYGDVVSLLATGFVNPSGRLNIVSIDAADPASCDPRKLRIDGATHAQFFLAVYRFVRLMRATGLSIAELDSLLAAVGVAQWPDTLDRLALALGIGERLHLSTTELAVLWADPGTRRYIDASGDSPRTLPSAYEAAFRSTATLAALLPANPAAAGWPAYGQVRASLPEALGIGSQEIDALFALAGVSDTMPASLGGLGKLYRHCVLARALGATIPDLGRFLALLAEAPFDVNMGALERTADRWNLFDAWSRAGYDVEYALGGSGPAAAEHEKQILAAAQALNEQLAALWEEAPAVREQRIAGTLSDLCGLDSGAVMVLAGRWLHAPRDRQLAAAARATVVGLLNDRQSWPAGSAVPTRANAAPVFDALTLLRRAGIAMGALSAGRDQWAWMFGRAALAGWLDVDLLPARPGEAAARFEALERLASWTRFWTAAPVDGGHATAYFDAVAAGDRASANRMLANATSVDAVQVDALLGTTAAGIWSATFPAGYLDAQVAQRLATAGVLAQRLKMAPAQLTGWFAAQPPAFSERMLRAECIRSAVFASLTAPDRERVQGEHARILRDACRSALVGLMLYREQAADTSELFDRYLIDVEMASAQLSMRTAQAVFATQLFVQRVLLNLEPAARLSEADAAQWSQWRKWYRVWEANRKVFLYPENWLEPEFRDDKSFFFRELESDLQQSDLTSEGAITAFGTYLDKLGWVSRLELVATHTEQDERGRVVTHLFARTRSVPVSYFYRRRIKDLQWTAWEKIDADVEGEFLVPVIHGKRLQLVWAIVTEDPGSATPANAAAWKVQFARSRRTDGGWKAKELIGRAFTQPALPGKEARDSFLFRSVTDASGDVRVLAFAAVEKSRPAEVAQPALLPIWPSQLGTHTGVVQVELRLVYQARPATGVPGVTATLELFVSGVSFGSSSGSGGQDGKARFNLPAGTSMSARLTLKQGDTDLQWSYLYGDPWAGNYQTLVGNERGLRLDTAYYVSMSLPIIVQVDPPPQPADPSRPVDWQQIEGIACSPSGATGPSPVDADAFLDEPALSVPSGMGFRPLDAGLHLSFSASSNSVLTSRTGDALLLGSAQRSGLFFRSAPLVWFVAAHPDLGFDTPFAISTAEGAYLGDATQSLLYLLKPDGSMTTTIRADVSLQSIHYPRDSALFGAWARLQLPSLAQPALQAAGGSADLSNALVKSDATSVAVTLVPEGVEFDHARPSSLYNWEIFLHAPWTIARRLGENKRYSEAQRWYHTIFDPTLGSDPAQSGELAAWRCRPIREALQRRETLFDLLADRAKLARQVQEWEDEPFQPHALARYRVRSYAVAILKDYVENLLNWGDDVAQRATLEAVNEATQLYLLAAGLLGPRPAAAIPAAGRSAETFSRLGDFDALSNPAAAALSTGAAVAVGGSAATPNLDLRYFCIPPNEDLLDLWARVEASLQRVRAGMAGSLFGPPIDPAILVRAAAAGLDIADVVAGLGAPGMPYRYAVIAQRALQSCGEVKALGAALLSAMEKKDAEELALLRSRHERALAQMQRNIRRQQVNEAQAQILVLRSTREAAAERLQHFRALLGNDDQAAPESNAKIARVAPVTARSAQSAIDIDARQLGLSPREVAHLQWANAANNFALTASVVSAISAVGHFFPNYSWNNPLTGTGMSYGGSNIGQGLGAVSAIFQALSANASYQAGASATVAGHERRRDDWAYQHNLVAAEIEQIDRQLEAASLRVEIATAELDYQAVALANAGEVDEYLRSKFSSAQLYQWMIRQLSGVYFQSYQLALQLARAAQTAFDQELAAGTPSQYIRPGYWDNLREGLLAGEQLALDLSRMDAEYLRANTRELEITRNVSLAMLDPLALISLRLTGRCSFRVPEVLFDLDFPGHYLRRVKSVSVSAPCVVGPYAGVPGTLTLVRGSTRTTPDLAVAPVPDALAPATASIATSNAQSDAGMFETNLRDDRYLPFEGAGMADSEWTFALPQEFRGFDYGTISDFVLHVRYTAREGGADFANDVRDRLRSALNAWTSVGQATGGLWRAFSLRHEFPSAWAALMAGAPDRQSLALDPTRFGALFRDSTLQVEEFKGFALMKGAPPAGGAAQLALAYGPATSRKTVVVSMDLPIDGYPDGLQGATLPAQNERPAIGASGLVLDFALDGTESGQLDDLYLCLRMSLR